MKEKGVTLGSINKVLGKVGLLLVVFVDDRHEMPLRLWIERKPSYFKRIEDPQPKNVADLPRCLKPARFMVYSPKDPGDCFYSCPEHLADVVEDGWTVAMGDIPDGELCCYGGCIEAGEDVQP